MKMDWEYAWAIGIGLVVGIGLAVFMLDRALTNYGLRW